MINIGFKQRKNHAAGKMIVGMPAQGIDVDAGCERPFITA